MLWAWDISCILAQFAHRKKRRIGSLERSLSGPVSCVLPTFELSSFQATDLRRQETWVEQQTIWKGLDWVVKGWKLLTIAESCWKLQQMSMPVPPWRNQECFVKIIGSCPSHERLYGSGHGKGDPWPMAMWPIQVLQGRSSTSLSAKWTKRRVRTNSSCWVWVDELWLADDQLMNYIVTGCA